MLGKLRTNTDIKDFILIRKRRIFNKKYRVDSKYIIILNFDNILIKLATLWAP